MEALSRWIRSYRWSPAVGAAAVWAGAAAALLAGGAAHAQLDAAKSTIVAVSRQMNVPVQGSFTKFDAQIAFDPAKPASGSAKITVDTASYDLGDPTYNDSVHGPEWFDAKTFPQATFVSTAIAPTGTNQYSVSGKLTIKGHTQNVAVPVVLTQQGGTQTFDGTLPIHRLAFEIGTGEWKDTSIVADEVLIKFHIVVAHK
ncbi:YceI family protein [Paraburkholderia guartelaensis]|jgi:polyisoprenoid-binding protein YceI|uniref:YceI family protein n=1 Tax=Paraburkholderia guartelaensis TaxID=2546446 RepID=A0A4R5LHV3_9BURK|nr:YceI family protein [Paraburkholderia guartelaensis]TDG08825.1 YceI family protein [Paraburkholderia guartelaensis]